MAVVDQELAACLRTWRNRVQAADVGLPAVSSRRVPGLRREEVAQLAGVSVDYLSRLEQGRAQRPSASVLAALARALRLSDDERSHLFRLAGQHEPGPGTIDRRIPTSLQRLMDRLGDVPVMVVDPAGEVIAVNPLAAALAGDTSGLPRRERILAWRHFTGLPARTVRTEEQLREAEGMMVADLQDALSRYPEDGFLCALIDDLRTLSAHFAELWEQRPVRRAPARRKTFDHAEIGHITVDCDALHLQGSDLTMIVYTAPVGSPEADALALLSAVGLQQFQS
jgi:hypothetical protein